MRLFKYDREPKVLILFILSFAQHEIAENIGIALFFYPSDRYLIPKLLTYLLTKKRNAGHHTGNYNNAIK